MKKTALDVLIIFAGVVMLIFLKNKGITDSPDIIFAVFGMGLFLAYLLGKLLGDYGLPGITSYLIMGVILGPFVMNIFTHTIIDYISFIDEVALSIIGLVAGGEINLRSSAVSLKKVLVFVIIQVLIIFGLVFGILYVAGGFLPIDLFKGIAAVVFMAIIANATSPSTTVAVILETGAKGRLTEYTLTSAILKDFLIIVLFTVTLSIFAAKNGGQGGGVMAIIMEETLSGVAGFVLGWVVILYIKYIKENTGVFILIFSIMMTWTCREIHLNPLLVFLFIGITVNNMSEFGKNFVHTVEENSGIIYLVFFFVAGTAINIPALKVMWVAAVFLVVLRTGSMFVGCYISGKAIKESDDINKLSYLGFLGQAGVSIGFAGIIGSTFPGWGREFQTLILAVVAINQIIGPLGFKWALKKAGETADSRISKSGIAKPKKH